MTDKATRTVLVLGGGVGGVVTAVELEKQLGESVRVVLVDRDRRHMFPPAVLRIMTGDQHPEEATSSLERLKEEFGVEFVEAEIETIEPADRTVHLADGRTIEGDQIVVALGAELAPETVPGLSEAGHNLYSRAGAESFRDDFAEFRSGRLVVLTPPGGYICPPAPFGASMLLDSQLRDRGVRDAVEIEYFDARPAPIGIAGPDSAATVQSWLDDRDIQYQPEYAVEQVDPAGPTLHFANGEQVEFDLLGYVPPHRSPKPVREAEMTDESGWIPVDRETLETDHDDVFAIGDVTHIPLAMGKPLPMAGVFAKKAAEVVAANIAADVEGRSPDATLDGEGQCFLETGDGRASIIEGDFFAEPSPELEVKEPARRWLWERLAYEKKWFFDWFKDPY